MLKILDAFCGVGGAAIGINMALNRLKIPHSITGVDIDQKLESMYPFEFVCDNAVEFIKKNGHNYDFIWTSPPCHIHSMACIKSRKEGTKYPDLVNETRNELKNLGIPSVIENVMNAPLIKPLILWMDMFGVSDMRRPRKFEIRGFFIKKLERGKKKEPYYRLISGGGGWIKGNEIGRVIKMPKELAEKRFKVKGDTIKYVSQIVPYHYSKYIMESYIKNKYETENNEL